MSGGVYGIRHIASDRYYIGSAANIRRRWRSHLHRLRTGKHHSIKLQRAWNKHGPKAFEWVIIEHVADEALLFTCEQHWLDYYRAFGRLGFNMHPNAGGPRGHKLSAEIRAAWSAARKGRKLPPLTPEHRAKISAATKGRKPKLSEAHRAKISATLLTRNRSPEMRAIRAERNRSPEMRAVAAKRNQSAEMRAIVSRPKSPAHAAKLRAILIKHNQSPEMRAIVSKPKTPQHRAAMSAAHQARLRRKAKGQLELGL